MLQRAEVQLQSDDGKELSQAFSDHAGMEPLETITESRKAQRAHDAGACGTLDETEEVQLLQNMLPLRAALSLPTTYLNASQSSQVKPQGQAKGAEKTIIGLPRRRQGLQKQATKLRPLHDLCLLRKRKSGSCVA